MISADFLELQALSRSSVPGNMNGQQIASFVAAEDLQALFCRCCQQCLQTDFMYFVLRVFAAAWAQA